MPAAIMAAITALKMVGDGKDHLAVTVDIIVDVFRKGLVFPGMGKSDFFVVGGHTDKGVPRTRDAHKVRISD